VLAAVQQYAVGLDPDEVDQDLATLARLGGRLLIPGDTEWPVRVDELAGDAFIAERKIAEPYALWVRGSLDLVAMTDRSIAVVGSRAASGYGEHVAAELSMGLAERGWTVISGGAYGIDAAAHRGALGVDGRTVVVLAGGPDVLYPRSHAAMLGRILEVGLVVSEVPPGFASVRSRFLSRNRLVAALTRGTVLVEAGIRSGALNTAGHALALGRPVGIVPGPVTSGTSVGCHRLLRGEGTRLVTSADEVLEDMAPVGEVLTLPYPGLDTPRDAVSAAARRLLDAVPARRVASAEELAKASGLSISDVFRLLGPLADVGLLEADVGGWRLTELGRAPAPQADGAPG
jgi:DNA processing protein